MTFTGVSSESRDPPSCCQNEGTESWLVLDQNAPFSTRKRHAQKGNLDLSLLEGVYIQTQALNVSFSFRCSLTAVGRALLVSSPMKESATSVSPLTSTQGRPP